MENEDDIVDIELANSGSGGSNHYSDEDDDDFSIEEGEANTQSDADVDSEYGEQTLTPNVITKEDVYRTTVRRQNCCFGISMITFAGLFVAAYFVMGLSFSPSNIGIFGDESALKGSSGEVGLDADNAETQEIVDEEVTELEKAGEWGEFGPKHTKAGKRSPRDKDKINERMKDHMQNIMGNDKVGYKPWVEDKDWWKDHEQDMDRTNMSKKELKEYNQMQKRIKRDETRIKRKKKHCMKFPDEPICQSMKIGGGEDATDLGSIREKLANHYDHEATGDAKEHYPQPMDAPYRDKQGPYHEKKHKKKHKHHHGDKDKDSDGDGDGDTNDVVLEQPAVVEENEKADVIDASETISEPDQHVEGGENAEDNIEQENSAEEGGKAEDVDAPEANAEPENPVQEEGKAEVKEIVNKFKVLKQVPHDKSSFTQGLSIGRDGTIFETTGLNGQSKVRRINPDTFEVELSKDVDGKYFGEGSTTYTDAVGNERLIEITWKKQTGFTYNAKTLEQLTEFKYTTSSGNQGWGITYDESNQEFIVSDGSQYLFFWDRDTLKEKRRVAVTRFNGSEQRQLNELEYIDGLVCANIWYQDAIICVDPVTGKSVREYDMSQLWPKNQRGGNENVLNGIALGKDYVLLTGKRWDRMYKVQFPDWPNMFKR